MRTSPEPDGGHGAWPGGGQAIAPAWQPPPLHPALGAQDIHLWRSSLDVPASTAREMQQVLSDEERTRAARIVVGRASARFVAGRWFLRTVLGRYLGFSAGQIELTYGPNGRPELALDQPAGPLSFSLAHSGDWAVIALARGRAIGVDVELVRPLSDMAGLVARVFSAVEQTEWRTLPPERKVEAFFRGWTGKEAWLKATSIGLTWPPDWLTLSLAPDSPLYLAEVRGDADAPQRWSLASFEAAPGCLGALAVEGPASPVDFFDYALSSTCAAGGESLQPSQSPDGRMLGSVLG